MFEIVLTRFNCLTVTFSTYGINIKNITKYGLDESQWFLSDLTGSIGVK